MTCTATCTAIQWPGRSRVVDDYGADLLYLRLKSTDADGRAKPPAEAAAAARVIVEAAGVPAIVVAPGDLTT